MRTQKGPPLTPRFWIPGRSRARALTRFSLDGLGEVLRLLDLAVLHDLLEDRLHLADVLGRGGVLLRRQLDDRRIGADVQEERLDAAALAVAVGVGVDGNEQVGPLLVGDDRPVVEPDVDVRLARQDGVDAGLFLEQLAQGQGDGQVDLFFLEPALADRARPRTAVAGIDDHGPDAEAQLTGHGRPVEVRIVRIDLPLYGRLDLVAGTGGFRPALAPAPASVAVP